MQLVEPSPSRRRLRAALPAAALVAALCAGLTVALAVAAPAAQARTRVAVVHTAARYARNHGYHIGIAVLDTRTGRFYGAGDYTGTYATESIVKVFIATRLLVSGQMVGSTRRAAYKMITQSDDGIASSLYDRVGGDSLINWVKARYHVPDLGSPPTRAGWWGNTHITPTGLVHVYAKLKRDPKVGPWLLNAMHHARKYGSDGTYQYFGIPSATHSWAIKQGWGDDYDDWSASADFNTSGFVEHNRYAVAILARGPIGTYGTAISNLLTAVARRLLPHGRFPAPVPGLTRLSARTGPSHGGGTLTIRGWSFSQVRAVWFGHTRARQVEVVSPRLLRVTIPPHRKGSVGVRVVTTHGVTHDLRYRYVPLPLTRALSSSSGSTQGGSTITVSGRYFFRVRRVLFGTASGTHVRVLGPTRLQVTVPPHGPGTVDVQVVDAYGSSPISPADRYTFQPGPRFPGDRAPATKHAPARR